MQFLKSIFCVILALSVAAVTLNMREEERELFKTIAIQQELEKRIPAYEKLLLHPLNDHDKAMLRNQIELEYEKGLLGKKKSILSKASSIFSKGKDSFADAMKKAVDKVKALKKTDNGLLHVVYGDTEGAMAAGKRVTPIHDPNPFVDFDEFGSLFRARF